MHLLGFLLPHGGSRQTLADVVLSESIHFAVSSLLALNWLSIRLMSPACHFLLVLTFQASLSVAPVLFVLGGGEEGGRSACIKSHFIYFGSGETEVQEIGRRPIPDNLQTHKLKKKKKKREGEGGLGSSVLRTGGAQAHPAPPLPEPLNVIY